MTFHPRLDVLFAIYPTIQRSGDGYKEDIRGSWPSWSNRQRQGQARAYNTCMWKRQMKA